jgi:UDP-N-acetylglucosamine acyltransferase
MAIVIHPTAIVHKKAQLGDNIEVGAFSIIEEDTVLSDNCWIGTHVNICSGTRLARNCRIFKGSNIGEVPQDLKFGGEKTLLEIGENTTVREYCALNRGTSATGKTVIGANSLLMAYCHVGHDCRIGNNLVAANCVNLAGHVEIGNHANIGGMTAIVQFRKIGDNVHIAAFSCIIKDIIPFATVGNDPYRVVGINRIGLARAGFSEERRRIIQRAYKVLFRSGLTVTDACNQLATQYSDNVDIKKIIDFANASGRGLLRMRETDVSDDA